MSAMDPELQALLKSLGFRAGQSVTAGQVNERLTAAYERGWADGERKLRDDIATGLREMADVKIIDPAKRSVIRLVAERVSCFPLRAEIAAEMKTEMAE